MTIDILAGRYQGIALDLIASILTTKKSSSAINNAIDLASRSNKKTLATKLYTVSEYLASGESVLESFHIAGMLKEETYLALKPIEDKKALTVDIIEETIADNKQIQKIFRALIGSLAYPTAVIFLMSFVGTNLISVAMGMTEEAYKGKIVPEFVAMYGPLGDSPILGAMGIAVVMSLISFVFVISLFNKAGKTELKLYQMATIISTLRQLKTSYPEVFSILANREGSRKFNEIYSRMEEESREQNIKDYIDPLLPYIPIAQAVSLITRIQSGDDFRGWLEVKEYMRDTAVNKIKALSDTMPIMSYIFLVVILGFSIAPLLTIVSDMMSNSAF